MKSRPPSTLILKAFACLLAFFAGGDDFNLARAALPALFPPASSEGLPLDDPNTDEAESAQSEMPAHVGQDSPCCRRPSPRSASAPHAPTLDGPSPRIPLSSPLRC